MAAGDQNSPRPGADPQRPDVPPAGRDGQRFRGQPPAAGVQSLQKYRLQRALIGRVPVHHRTGQRDPDDLSRHRSAGRQAAVPRPDGLNRRVIGLRDLVQRLPRPHSVAAVADQIVPQSPAGDKIGLACLRQTVASLKFRQGPRPGLF